MEKIARKPKIISLAEKVNVLRASVMGANDGILSIAGIVIGVTGAAVSNNAIFLAGISGLLAGTVSMAMGEYVSVNAQRDTERKAIIEEQNRLDTDYEGEVAYITAQYQGTGIQAGLAEQATREMMAHDPLNTAVRERYGFDATVHTSAIQAAIASMIAFPTGSVLPLLAILLLPLKIRVIGTMIAVVIGLALTGYVAAALGKANRKKAVLRNVISGLITMTLTYMIGSLFA